MILGAVSLAACIASTGNLMMRKNIDLPHQGSPRAYLFYFFFFSLLFALIPWGPASFHPTLFLLGLSLGTLNFWMMALTNRCLQLGPAGLTFAFQNGSAILPSILLFSFFGPAFGFGFTVPLILGLILVVAGLALGAKNEMRAAPSWLLTALAMFFVQGSILTLLQWRALLLQEPPHPHPLIPWIFTPAEEFSFLPGYFLSAALLQGLVFGRKEKRWGTKREFTLGFVGGGCNFFATTLLLYATKTAATPTQKAILFPLFSVSVIAVCSLWGRALYKERVYWLGLLLCLAGVFIGTISR